MGHGPMGPWAHGPMGPWGPWAHGAHGPMGPWAHGPMGALDGGSDRDKLLSVVCRLSVCRPPRDPPTPTDGAIILAIIIMFCLFRHHCEVVGRSPLFSSLRC